MTSRRLHLGHRLAVARLSNRLDLLASYLALVGRMINLKEMVVMLRWINMSRTRFSVDICFDFLSYERVMYFDTKDSQFMI